jgi:ribulose-5-phosphate 4-epimerase/fuculose-1-phosphate aldolase
MLPNFLSGDSAVAVVKGEGSYATGRTLEEAYKLTSCLENSCKIIVAVRSSGQPRPSQQPMPQHKDRSMHRSGPAIPPGIGVMDRSRYHKR